MKALRLHAGGDLRLHDEPRPTPAEDEALVRITAVGICGSDLHWFGDAGIGDARLERPLVLGHEFGGVVESGALAGRRVAVDPAVPCLRCEFCLDGHPNLCENVRFAGHGEQDGALREYMAWPERCLFPVPDDFTAADVAMLEPLGVAIHAVDLGKIRTGMTVGIFGAGPIGLLIMQVARAAGATRVLVTDPLEHRLETARELGADEVFVVDAGREAQAVVDATGGGVEVAFEAANEPEAAEAAVDAVRGGGLVVLTGIPHGDRTCVRASTARRKGLTVKWTRRMKHVYPRAIDLVARGRVDVRSVVSQRFPLADAETAFQTAQQRSGLKVIIAPSEDESR